MTVRFDVELTPEQREALAATDPRWWFTRFEFGDVASPAHPRIERLEMSNAWKRAMVEPWLARLAPGKRVLDVFCANGGFSYEAARLGAAEVLGVDYDPDRIECARFVSGLLDGAVRPLPRFEMGDVYRLAETVPEAFDLTLVLGGLYHVADPVLVLRNLRAATSEHMIFQTSRVLRFPGSWAKFITVRRTVDRTEGSAGVWKLSPTAIETMLRYAGFEIVERLSVPRLNWRRRVPWYGAVCRAVER